VYPPSTPSASSVAVPVYSCHCLAHELAGTIRPSRPNLMWDRLNHRAATLLASAKTPLPPVCARDLPAARYCRCLVVWDLGLFKATFGHPNSCDCSANQQRGEKVTKHEIQPTASGEASWKRVSRKNQNPIEQAQGRCCQGRTEASSPARDHDGNNEKLEKEVVVPERGRATILPGSTPSRTRPPIHNFGQPAGTTTDPK
jgi:hypothetical protein